MLKRLQVTNYVLIDSLEIDFPKGLVIITGQTGAGKSILLGALSLALGAKADASIIGESSDKCVVEAEFGLSGDNETLKTILGDNEVEWDDDSLLLRRVVGSSGRARTFVNDCPVNNSVLAAIAPHLIDIHSQHQTLMLSDRKYQLSMLDHFAGCTQAVRELAAEYRAYLALKSELEEVEAKIARAQGEREYNEARFAKLDGAALKDGELEELEAEQKQLANAEDIKENLYAVEDLFTAESSAGERMPMDSALRECERRLEKVAGYLFAADALRERLSSVRIEMEDILSEVMAINSGTGLSQERLEQVEERISLIYGLLRQFSCADVAELIAQRDALSEVLYDSTALESRRDELEQALNSGRQEAERLADRVHEARLLAAPAFANAIQTSIRSLELQYAVFEVDVQDAPLSQSGRDAVLFKFSANGRNPVDIAKCASGGELSRIMLCLKDMMARYTNMPAMIFDEIDTGVTGSVADKMGSMICCMGENMQVFAITHLPQVAAKGEAHYFVSKSIDADTAKAVTTIEKLSEERRVMVLAAMLSGSELSEAAIANAKDLLNSRGRR